MPAGKHDIIIEQGATFRRVITWKDSAGVPINLTGWSAKMQVRERVRDGDVVLECSTANGRITLGGTAGTITIVAQDEVTALLPEMPKAVYDLELISGGGEVTRLLRGQVEIAPEVTR
jgi:hypothetical protein